MDKAHRLAELRRQAAELCGDVCRICGTTPVEYAHVRPTKLRGRGRGAAVRFGDIVKHPQCYAPFCSAHHREFDAGRLKLL